MSLKISGNAIKKYIPENSETEIIIPDGTEVISSYAFEDCFSLKKIILSQSIMLVEKDAFSGCSPQTEIVIPENYLLNEKSVRECARHCKISFGEQNADYYVRDNVLYEKNSNKIVIIPEYVSSIHLSEQVTCLETRTFAGYYHLKDVFIPDTVQKYQRGALCGIHLETLSIPYARTLELAFHANQGWVGTCYLRMPGMTLKICSPLHNFKNSSTVLLEVLQILRTGDLTSHLNLVTKASPAVYLAVIKKEPEAQSYLKKTFVRLSCALIDNEDMTALRMVLDTVSVQKKQLDKLISHAIARTQDTGNAEMQLALMNYKHEHFPDSGTDDSIKRKFRL